MQIVQTDRKGGFFEIVRQVEEDFGHIDPALWAVFQRCAPLFDRLFL
jgi:hypothetical protein